MNADKTIKIDTMPPEEAWKLFQKIVGNRMQSDVENIAKDVAAQCGGLPIALVTLAKALSNKDINTWKDAHRQLQEQNVRRIPGMENNMYKSINMSLEFLAREAKPLFLLSCQHPEDAKVKVEKLAMYCLALRLLKNVDTLEDARNIVSSLVEHLHNCVLLEAVDVDDVKFVKIHDVVRDLGLSILSNVKEERDPVYMKITDQATEEAADYSNLKILLMSGHDSALNKEFLLQMVEPSVLAYSRQGRALQLPAVEVLTNLRMLSLECAKLDEHILSKIAWLTKMEILSFRECEIGPFPRQIVQLTNLKLLDLRSSSRFEESRPIPGGILPELNKLEDLYLGKYCFSGTREEGESHGRIAELEMLSNLTTLQIQLLNPMQLLDLKHLCFENLQGFSFATVETRVDSERIGRSLVFKGLSLDWILEDKIQFIVRSTEQMALSGIDWTDPLIL